MARNLEPKCKQCRREGIKLFLKGERCFSTKCALVKRNYVPGAQGQKQGPGNKLRVSDFGKQFREKQRAKKTYRIMEKQLLVYFKKASQTKGNSSLILSSLLERRLDNAIFRMGLASSRDEARQLVTHGHFLVNNKKINIPSYQVNPGDVINIREKSLGFLQDNIKNQNNKDVPAWLIFEPKDNKGQVIGLPEEKDLDTGIDMKMIVGFYAR